MADPADFNRDGQTTPHERGLGLMMYHAATYEQAQDAAAADAPGADVGAAPESDDALYKYAHINNAWDNSSNVPVYQPDSTLDKVVVVVFTLSAVGGLAVLIFAALFLS